MTEHVGAVVDTTEFTDHELVVSAYHGLLGPAYRQSAYVAVDAPVTDPDDLDAAAATLIRQDVTGTGSVVRAPLAASA